MENNKNTKKYAYINGFILDGSQDMQPESGKMILTNGQVIEAIETIEKTDKTDKTDNIEKTDKIESSRAYNVNSVICLGRIEFVTDQDKTIQQTYKLAKKFYPSEEEIRRVLERSGMRVQTLAMTIDYISGKLVKES